MPKMDWDQIYGFCHGKLYAHCKWDGDSYYLVAYPSAFIGSFCDLNRWITIHLEGNIKYDIFHSQG